MAGHSDSVTDHADLAGEQDVVATPDQPATRDERISSLDFIRGVAVLGILFANITAMGHPYIAYLWPDLLPDGGTDTDSAVWLFQFIFIDGKMRGIFTILFGAGLYLFLERAWARGSGRGLQARRLCWLMLFGLLHFVFLFRGDILVSYAVWGLVTLLAVKWKPSTLMITGLITYGIMGLLMVSGMGMQAWLEADPSACTGPMAEACSQMDLAVAQIVKNAGEASTVYSTGSYGDVLAYTISDQSSYLIKTLSVGIFETLPLMLIGIALYRMGLFTGGMDRAKLVRWGWIGVVVGIALQAPLGWWVVREDFPFQLTNFVFGGALHFARLPMLFGLLWLTAAYGPSLAQGWLGQRFVAAGRAAFTNYIGCSAFFVIVFQGWAFGLFGQLSRLELVGWVIAAWIIMLAWSKPWLERYRYGPLEWLWRCLTYWKLFPLRR